MTPHPFRQALTASGLDPIVIRKGPHGFTTEAVYSSRREAEDAVQVLKPYATSFALAETSLGGSTVWALRFVTVRVKV